jgi:hypothetical protein
VKIEENILTGFVKQKNNLDYFFVELTINKMTMRPVVYCILDFFQSASSLLSLCVSGYGLAYSIGKPWMWNNILLVGCISTTILCHAFRQSFDKLFFERYIIHYADILENKQDGSIVPTTNHQSRNIGSNSVMYSSYNGTSFPRNYPQLYTRPSQMNLRSVSRVQSLHNIPQKLSTNLKTDDHDDSSLVGIEII